MSKRLAEIKARAARLLEQTGPPDDGVSRPTEYEYLVFDVCDDDVPALLELAEAAVKARQAAKEEVAAEAEWAAGGDWVRYDIAIDAADAAMKAYLSVVGKFMEEEDA